MAASNRIRCVYYIKGGRRVQCLLVFLYSLHVQPNFSFLRICTVRELLVWLLKIHVIFSELNIIGKSVFCFSSRTHSNRIEIVSLKIPGDERGNTLWALYLYTNWKCMNLYSHPIWTWIPSALIKITIIFCTRGRARENIAWTQKKWSERWQQFTYRRLECKNSFLCFRTLTCQHSVGIRSSTNKIAEAYLLCFLRRIKFCYCSSLSHWQRLSNGHRRDLIVSLHTTSP